MLPVTYGRWSVSSGHIQDENLYGVSSSHSSQQPLELSMATIGLAVGLKQFRGHRRNIIYCRFSDAELQTVESIENQRRRCFDFLKRSGCDPQDFEIITDEGESALLASRPGWNAVLSAISAGHLGLLLVSEQSRIDRADLAMSIARDIVAQGGRYIAVSDNIDTEENNWQNRVRLAGFQHSFSSDITAARVFEGLKGRILDGNGSAGDFPYGFKSVYRDSDTVRLTERKGHFRKDICIDEKQAVVIRLVFKWYAGGMRIAAIARELITSGIDIPPNRRGTIVFEQHHIRKILQNSKYVGEWYWGVTRSLRDGKGVAHLHPRQGGPAVQIARPDLRIIDSATWEAAQKKLAAQKECYGIKAHETKPRGVNCDFRILHLKTLTRGLIFCSACGAKMTVTGSTKGGKNVGCPNRLIDTCDRRALVPVDLAEQKVGECLSTALCADHVWLPKLMASMRSAVDAVVADIPREHERLRGDLDTTNKSIANIVGFIIKGNGSEALGVRLNPLNLKKEILNTRLNGSSP